LLSRGIQSRIEMGNRLCTLVLFAGGPFYSYPHKFFINDYVGGIYEEAFANFSRDHSTRGNLIAHLALVICQVGWNYAFLGQLEKKLNGPYLSMSTMLLSVVAMCAKSSAPHVAKLASVALVVSSYLVRNKLSTDWFNATIVLEAVLEVLGSQVYVLNKSDPNLFDLRITISLVLLRLGLHFALIQPRKGSLSKYNTYINIAILGFLLKTCQDPFRTPEPFLLGFFASTLSILTNQKWLNFFGANYLFSLSQGVSHILSREEPTLPSVDNIAHEYAHSTFLPVLVFHKIFS